MITLTRASCVLLVVPLTALSSCAMQEQMGTAPQGNDLGWLWGLIGVIALFVLGGVVYKIRNPKGRPHSKAPERRIVVKRRDTRFD